jgi:hypothetical protein
MSARTAGTIRRRAMGHAMASRIGLEPITSSLGNLRSILMSYRDLPQTVCTIGLRFVKHGRFANSALTLPYRALALCVLVSCAAVSPVLASCGPDDLERVRLQSVSPEGDLILADSRRLRLAGLFLQNPDLTAHLKPGDALAIGILGETKDRWSRAPAIVFTLKDAADPQWLQEMLLRGGQALARPEEGLGDCWVLLKKAEAAVRTGLPKTAPEGGRFLRAEGRIQRVSEGRSAHFITLFDASGGRITGLIQKRHMKRFSQAGVDVGQLRGQFIRLRGVRSVRNASVIPLTLVDQIEIVR